MTTIIDHRASAVYVSGASILGGALASAFAPGFLLGLGLL